MLRIDSDSCGGRLEQDVWSLESKNRQASRNSGVSVGSRYSDFAM